MSLFSGVRSLLLLAILATGFSVSSDSASQPLKVIKVGCSPVLSSIGIYLAAEEGYFRDAGLNVEITDFAGSGAPMTLLLENRQLDVGAGNLTAALFEAIGEGKKLRLVADKGHLDAQHDYIQLLVRTDLIKNGRYKHLQDLKGLKFGLTTLEGVSQHVLFDRFLHQVGLSDKQVEFVKLTYPEINAALKSGAIDGAVQIEPYLTQALIEGFAQSVATGDSVYPQQQSAAVIYGPSLLERTEQGVQFMTAYLKGVRLYIKSQTDDKLKHEIAERLKRQFPLSENVWNKMIPIGIAADGHLELASIDSDLNWYVKNGKMKKVVAAKDIVEPQFATTAASRLDADQAKKHP